MDKALVFGTKDCRFESCQGHIFHFGPKAFHFDFHYDLACGALNWNESGIIQLSEKWSHAGLNRGPYGY